MEDLRSQIAQKELRLAVAAAGSSKDAEAAREELRLRTDQLKANREELQECLEKLSVTMHDAAQLRRRLDEAERELEHERQQRKQAEADLRGGLEAAKAVADQALSAAQRKLRECTAAHGKREQRLKDKLCVARAQALTLRAAGRRATERERQLLEAEPSLRRLLDFIAELKPEASSRELSSTRKADSSGSGSEN